MAITIKDGLGANVVIKTTDNAGVHTAHKNIDSLPPLATGTNVIGSVDIGVMAPLVAGTANIGDVDVLTLPALVAGTANIGDVDVLTLPALVAGSAKIGAVDLDSDAAPGVAVPATAQFIAGTDGTLARGIKTDAAGELQVDVLTLPSVVVSTLPALVAGTANIGNVDVLTLPALVAGTANIGDVDIASGPTGASSLQNQGAAASGATKVGNPVLQGGVFNTTQPTVTTGQAVDAQSTARGAQIVAPGVDGFSVTVVTMPTVVTQGTVAHDAPDSGNPDKLGAKTIAHGTNPTAVAAADRTDLYANRAGILFTIGGHPNTITRSVLITDATGVQTDASIVGVIAAGTKVVVTALTVTVDQATTAANAVKIGFGATTIPADSATGAAGVLLDHGGIPPGSGVVIGNGAGILGIGADGEELRLTCEDPVGGELTVTFSYFTIES